MSIPGMGISQYRPRSPEHRLQEQWATHRNTQQLRSEHANQSSQFWHRAQFDSDQATKLAAAGVRGPSRVQARLSGSERELASRRSREQLMSRRLMLKNLLQSDRCVADLVQDDSPGLANVISIEILRPPAHSRIPVRPPRHHQGRGGTVLVEQTTSLSNDMIRSCRGAASPP